jgi:CO/xanthine dehydrogenase FAD-binding subunit
VRPALSTLTLREPRTLRDALRLLRDEGPLTPLAGCTDVFVQFNFGTQRAKHFLDLSRLTPLRRLRVDDGRLVIGAMATYTDLIRSRLVRGRLPMLAAAAREVGGPQIQHRGTIGGNVVNGSPAGDTLPVLAAVDAVLVLASTEGERRVPFTQFYTGYRASVLRSDELLVAIEVAPVEGRQWFRKVGTRAAQAISKVVMAAVRNGTPRIALGSVAPTVVRLPRTEGALAAGADIAAARRVLAEEIRPIDDLRSTARYRLRVAANLLSRFWADTADE